MVDTSTEAVTRLLDGVTPGPWDAESGHVQQNGQLYWQVTDKNHAIMQNQFCWCQGDHAANARFIAAARDLVPALLAERDAQAARADAAEARAASLRRDIWQAMQDAREAAMREADEATDPDFIWGALDNVHDAETTLDDYAAAVSRAQRAALSAIAEGRE